MKIKKNTKRTKYQYVFVSTYKKLLNLVGNSYIYFSIMALQNSLQHSMPSSHSVSIWCLFPYATQRGYIYHCFITIFSDEIFQAIVEKLYKIYRHLENDKMIAYICLTGGLYNDICQLGGVKHGYPLPTHKHNINF